MANNADKPFPDPQQMRNLLTQVQFANPLPSTGVFNSQSDDNDNSHNKNGPTMDSGNNDMVLLKSKFDHALQLYRFMHENKNDEGKKISGLMRKNKFKEILDLYNNLQLSQEPIGSYFVNAQDIQWASFYEDEKYWRLWDEKEAMIREDKNGRGRYPDRSRERREMEVRSDPEKNNIPE